MTWYFIESDDVFMFGDGRPFNAGDVHVSNSLFPPSAITLQGALRYIVLMHDPNYDLRKKPEHHQFVGLGNELGEFTMEGPYLAAYIPGEEKYIQYLPLPADIAYTKNQNFRFIYPQESNDRQATTNLPHGVDSRVDWLPISAYGITNYPEPCWLPAHIYRDVYMNGIVPSRATAEKHNGIKFMSELVVDEPRFGIARDYESRVAKEGMLYRAVFKRLRKGMGLLVQLPDTFPIDSDTFTIPIGGERRTARIRKCESDSVTSLTEKERLVFQAYQDSDLTRLKVVLYTPSYFKSGWKPPTWSHILPGSQLRSAIVDHPMILGGWQLITSEAGKSRRGPRQSIRMVPGGSVYYFECAPNAQIPTVLSETPETDYPQLSDIGYGRFVATNW